MAAKIPNRPALPKPASCSEESVVRGPLTLMVGLPLGGAVPFHPSGPGEGASLSQPLFSPAFQHLLPESGTAPASPSRDISAYARYIYRNWVQMNEQCFTDLSRQIVDAHHTETLLVSNLVCTMTYRRMCIVSGDRTLPFFTIASRASPWWCSCWIPFRAHANFPPRNHFRHAPQNRQPSSKPI